VYDPISNLNEYVDKDKLYSEKIQTSITYITFLQLLIINNIIYTMSSPLYFYQNIFCRPKYGFQGRNLVELSGIAKPLLTFTLPGKMWWNTFLKNHLSHMFTRRSESLQVKMLFLNLTKPNRNPLSYSPTKIINGLYSIKNCGGGIYIFLVEGSGNLFFCVRDLKTLYRGSENFAPMIFSRKAINVHGRLIPCLV